MTAPCKTCQRDNDGLTHTALEAFGHLNHEYVPDRPEIVVLCGSTRFKDEINRANADLTMQGRVTPDPVWFDAIVRAVTVFEATVAGMVAAYNAATEGLPMTERVVEPEMSL